MVPAVNTTTSLPPPSPNVDPSALAALPQHGLFVAGLAHHVAPGSNIMLYRVLDEYARGDLFTLNVSLRDFIVNQVMGDPSVDHGAVINLSLGVNDLQSALSSLNPDRIALAEAAMAGLDPAVSSTLVELEPDNTATSLAILLEGARQAHISVVAAAGNDSGTASSPQEPQIPARFPGVVAVASTNSKGAPSCFSNQGSVAAPGGEGRPVNGAQCQPVADTCGTTCDFGVLGPIWQSQPTVAPFGFVWWTGTSFSTPLVSGWEALYLANNPWPTMPRAMTTPTWAPAPPTIDVQQGTQAGATPPPYLNP